MLLEVDGDSGRIVSLKGNPDHPFTAGALCGKVNRSLEGIYGPERLTHPLVRVGRKGEGRFERASWDDALDLVADGLRSAIDRHGPESILPLCFGGNMGHVQSWVFGPRLFAHLGASRLDQTMCDGAAAAACRYLLGGSVGFDPEDIVHAKLVILWGINTITANMHHWKFILEARRRGSYLVAIDPIRTDTAAKCDQHVAPMPGTDAALALGLMRTILDEGAVDDEWLELHAIGWEQLRERLGEWPVERAAEITALDEDVIRELGRRIARTRPTALRTGLGMQRTAGGGAAIRAIMALPALTGDWRHLGGGALSQTSNHFPYRWPRHVEPSWMTAPRARRINISRVAEALTELDDPPIAATVVWNFNPVASNPNQNRVVKGFARSDLFVAVIEQRLTDTTDYADVVLPAASHFEQLDIVNSYGQNYLGWNPQAVEPYGESLPNAEILRRIGRRLGVTDKRVLCTELELIEEFLDTPACKERGITAERLRTEGFIWAADFERGTAPFANGGFPTRSGKVELWSERARRDGLDPLVGYSAPREVTDRRLAERFPIVLITPATRFFLNSTFASLDWHRKKSGAIRLLLHPDDAASRGIENGSVVRVFNDRGAFIAEAWISDAARTGVAMAPKQYWRRFSPGKATPNATTPEADADMGGAPTYHDNRVEVVALTPAEQQAIATASA